MVPSVVFGGVVEIFGLELLATVAQELRCCSNLWLIVKFLNAVLWETSEEILDWIIAVGMSAITGLVLWNIYWFWF